MAGASQASSAPPSIVPNSTASTVATSIQPLAATSRRGGISSVTRPYLAGEYSAAPAPASAKHGPTGAPSAIAAQAPALSALAALITVAFGTRSASGPTKGASST